MTGNVQSSLRWRLAALLAAWLGGLSVTVPVGAWSRGSAGILAAMVAGLVCLTSAAAAVLVSQTLRSNPRLAMYEVLSGTGFRMAMPLMLCMVVYQLGGRLVEGLFVFHLLAFYLLMLLTEIVVLICPSGFGKTLHADHHGRESF